jgi:hypothetical protein
MKVTMKKFVLLLAGLALAASAHAANDRFWKDKPGSMNGFLAVTDPVYVKECGSCHFAYSPGLLPARSWARHMERLDKHFGESVQLSAATRDAIASYLTQNAADVSRYEGSLTFMEEVGRDMTPYRLNDVPLFRQMHRIVREVIDLKPKIKVRTTTNCNGCHQRADDGSFGLDELVVPGLTRSR